jgi:ParB/RepB/Spo0J family partition protein
MSESAAHVGAEFARLRVKTRDASARVTRVSLDRIRFHPDNIRRDIGDVAELAGSIKAHGVLQPLMAEMRGDYLQLLMGHRRLAAAYAAGLRTVPVVVVREHARDEAMLMMLAENTRRRDISTRDRAAALRGLIDQHGYNRSQLAEHLGVTPTTITNWLGESTEPAPATARPARRRPPIVAPKALQLCEKYAAATDNGMSALEATALLTEIRELLAGWRPKDEESAA